MGYLTIYKLRILNTNEIGSEGIEQFRRACYRYFRHYSMFWGLFGEYNFKVDDDFTYEKFLEKYENFKDSIDGHDMWKWYDYNIEMLFLSKQLPNILFELSGHGEEDKDYWKCYYINGKFQEDRGKVIIIYEGYNPDKLVNGSDKSSIDEFYEKVEKLENERLTKEKIENEKLESERLEAERLEKERLEKLNEEQLQNQIPQKQLEELENEKLLKLTNERLRDLGFSNS